MLMQAAGAPRAPPREHRATPSRSVQACSKLHAHVFNALGDINLSCRPLSPGGVQIIVFCAQFGIVGGAWRLSGGLHHMFGAAVGRPA